MTSQPLVSIVIPAFNAERFLSRTLASALGQTHTQTEIIVVNDGSTDSTRYIVEKAASQDARLRMISIRNGGVAVARNTGLDAARGEFVAFLDADDLWHPTKLENQVATLTTQNVHNAAATYTLMRLIDVNDRVVRNGSAVGHSGYIFARHLFSRPVGNGSSLFLFRELALSLGGFDASWAASGLGGCEDLDFELRIAAKHPITAIRRYLVGYRAYAGNMSSNGLALARSVLSTVEHHIHCHPELPEWAIRKARASTLEYALQNIASVGQWQLFLSELVRLQRLDFARALEYILRFSIRRFRDRLQHANADHAQRRRPSFYDLSPDWGTERLHRAARSRDSKVVGDLEVLDCLHFELLRSTAAK